MSQNKFMHPRNIYKKPPSFKDLAIKYPAFRRFAKPDISGKITLDFKDPEALRALTRTLLEKDFNLLVDIPLTRLIPTLPLRLNYLLWIEDLLDVIGIQRSDYAFVSGIDIGTGASCIYPLLAAKQNTWHMVATEVDDESVKVAETNVNTNNLQHLVTVKQVEGNKLLMDILEDNKNYTFSMCNPPFFSSEQDLDFTSKSRSPCRPPPHNGTTGDLKELVAPGGEVAFVLKIMEESRKLGTKIKIYTTMLGHKSSIAVLKLELKKLNVASMTETRFCQGNTTRWGIAWTYDESCSLQKAYQTPSQKKSNTPMAYVVPPEAVKDETMYTVEVITERVMDILQELQAQHQLKRKNKFMTMIDVVAFKNTWSHQRKRKRQADKLYDQGKNIAVNCLPVQTEHKDIQVQNLKKNSFTLESVLSGTVQDGIASKKTKTDDVGNFTSTLNNTECETAFNPATSNMIGENTYEVSLAKESNAVTTENEDRSLFSPIIEATVFVRSIASEIHVEFLWKGGTGGRESMHQVLQYVKNKLK